jgi:adenosylhomocysteine nucleosidase
MKILRNGVLLFVIIFSGCQITIQEEKSLIAIIGAFDEELEFLKEQMQQSEVIETNNMRVVKGILNGKNVVMALSGMGKVNAAMTTTYLIHQYNPEKIIFSGIAGGLNSEIEPGDIVIGEKTVQHDLVIWTNDSLSRFITYNPTNGEEVPLYHHADNEMLEVANKVSQKVELAMIKTTEGDREPKIIVGTIACGDAFIASSKKKEELINKFGADAVEMEGAAIAQVCRQFGIPVIVIRSISDSADEEAHTTIEGFYKTAAKNSATFVMEMLKEL